MITKIIISLLFSSAVMAQITLEECSEVARFYGDATQPETPPAECYNLVDQLKNHNNFMSKLDYSAVVQNNLAYIEIPFESSKKVNLIAGSKTLLNNALAVELSIDEDRLYILDADNDSREVLSFPLSFGGNLAPRRKLISDEIDLATNIKVDYERKLLYVMSETQGWIKVFNLHADPDGKRPENSIKSLREISGVQTDYFNPKDIAVSEAELFVLSNNKILSFQTEASGDATPLREISGSATQLNNAQTLEYDSINHEIVIVNLDNTVLRFSANAQGNATPN